MITIRQYFLLERKFFYMFKKLLYPLSYQTTIQLFELHDLYLEVHCIRYELRLFMPKVFPLLKLIMAKNRASSVILWPGLEPETSPSKSRFATTEPNLLGFLYNIRCLGIAAACSICVFKLLHDLCSFLVLCFRIRT